MTHNPAFEHPYRLVSDCPAVLLEAWQEDAVPRSADCWDLGYARHQQQRHIPQPRAAL